MTALVDLETVYCCCSCCYRYSFKSSSFGLLWHLSQSCTQQHSPSQAAHSWTRASLFCCDRVVFLCSAWLQARAAAMAERKQQRSEAKEWLDEAVPKLTGK